MDTKSTIYMIGNAHLDPVWMWRWQEGAAEAKATCRSALDRMNEYPDFKFVCSSASIYQWLEESAPEMMDEIRMRIREGRWIVIGGWWVQPDCNLPSGEGFARQSLYAQRYFKNTLGVTATIGYCVDSFGHNRMLPQILRKSGMNAYMFMRPGEHEYALPHTLFKWESPDGSQVTALRFSLPYCCNFTSAEDLQAQLEKVTTDIGDDVPFTMCLYGVGNHGGGPTIQNIELIRAYRAEHPDKHLPFADPAEFFAAAEKLPLSVWQDDLQHHAAGCYAAFAPIKTAMRKSETRLLAAEKFATVAAWQLNRSYPLQRFEDAWRNVCFLHFHDILGGCAVRKSYDDSLEFAGEALSVAAKAENAALQSLSWAIDTSNREKGLPIVLFNPHAWEVTADVVLNKYIEGITDTNGTPVPLQHVHSEVYPCFGRDDTLFRATVPALGYATYYAHEGVAMPADAELHAENNVLENKYLRVTFDAHTGCITSLFDKQQARETLSGNGAQPVVIDEYAHDTWSHAKNYFDNQIACFTDASVAVIENGPVRATVRVTARYNDSKLVQDFSLSADSDRLTVNVTLDWHEQHKMLKLAFPLQVNDKAASYYNIPYGWIKRPCNGEEEPGQMWIAVQDDENGVALLNESKYSFSVKDNTMCLTAIRSPLFADHGRPRTGMDAFTDQGEHRFRYALQPYVCGTKPNFAHIARCAEEFNTPLTVIIENNHNGMLADHATALTVSSENIIVSALKQAEDRNGWILRAYETAGNTEAVCFRLPLLNGEVHTAFTPFEVKTLRLVPQEDGSIESTEVLLTEYDLP